MLVAILLLLAAISVPITIATYFTYSKNHQKSPTRLDNLSHKDELRLINLIGGLSDGLIVFDNNFRPWIVNDAARSFLSITKQEPSFADIVSSFPHDTNLSERVKEVIEFDRSTILHEVTIGAKTFKIIISAVASKNHINIDKNDSLKDVGASILLQDLSSEKALEKQKEDFSNVIVHELRAPVVAIKDSASLLLSGNVNENDEKNILNMIHTQAEKLLTQISYILDADKVEQGRLSLNKTVGDIGRVTKERVELFLPEAKRKNISLIPVIGNDIPNFSFDNEKIVEAINNLISNSLKYTNEGGMVKITVDADDKYKNTKSEGSVMVSVSDNGLGIAQDKQKLLFTKFGQLNSGKDTENVSSGLGLYITKGIVEAHGGQISVHSSEGKGTIVTFNLPIGILAPELEDKILSTSAR